MTSSESKKPTLAIIRARAAECGIEIAAEREAPILAGAKYLHDAAARLDCIAVADTKPSETARR